MKYTYKVHRVDVGGMATVEYVSPELGSITRVFVVPYDRGEEQVRRKVVEAFPLDLFYSRWLSTNFHKLDAQPEDAQVNGEMDVDFDDHFYDIQEIVSEASPH